MLWMKIKVDGKNPEREKESENNPNCTRCEIALENYDPNATQSYILKTR